MSFFTRLMGKSVPTLGVQELYQKLTHRDNPFLLDVRQPEEFRLGHIAGATLIPLGELRSRIDEVPHGREIVCICASGHRSIPAVQLLLAAGYSASSMDKGMLAWQMAKFPIKKGVSG